MNQFIADSSPCDEPRLGAIKQKIFAVFVSAIVLTLLYVNVDIQRVLTALRDVNGLWLAGALLLLIPIIVLTAGRFRWIFPANTYLTLPEATRLVLLAITLNLVFPAKLGDLSKSYFSAKYGRIPLGFGIAAAAVERLYDILAITSWCLLGILLGIGRNQTLTWIAVASLIFIWCACFLLIFFEKTFGLFLGIVRKAPALRKLTVLEHVSTSWSALHKEISGRKVLLALYSGLLWLVHLTQIWMFVVAVGGNVPFATSLVLSALVLAAAMMPFTIAGLGARDVAIVVFFAGFLQAETAVSVGILAASRSFLPPLATLPFLARYLTEVRREIAKVVQFSRT